MSSRNPRCANFLGLLTHRCRQSRYSLCAKRRIQSVDQRLFANRLVQEANRSRPKRSLSCLCVPEISDEDDWNGLRRNQVPLQLEAIHPRHRDVEDRAGHVWKLMGVEEIAGRSEDRCSEPDELKQALECLAERLIVIDDRDESLAILLFRCVHSGKSSSERRCIPAHGSKTSYTLVLLGFSGLILRRRELQPFCHPDQFGQRLCACLIH